MTIRTIEVRERVMAVNDAIAAGVRRRLADHGVPAFNLVSSPGAGKTLLLERTLEALGGELRIAVVTGDVQTQNDAERLSRHTSRLVHAVITGGACHLDARQVEAALADIDLANTDMLFIENVGNLICPASWDLGETAKIALFSVTEGDDKPVKYPQAFRKAETVVFTKLDLLPHVPFDIRAAESMALSVNPQIRFVRTSALSGEGMDAWYECVRQSARAVMGS